MQTETKSNGAAVPGGPQWNALKHGLRSAAVLLPGDDVAEFQALRHDLFHTYQPCTRDEADCVESMTGYKWRIAHCQRVQAAFRMALDGLVLGGPAGHICEPDPHRWQHRSMDCTLEEQRLHKLLTKDRSTLFELQRMRRNRLIDGAIGVVASYLEFLGEEEPAEPNESAEKALVETPATRSAHGGNAEILKRTSATEMARVLGLREVAMRWIRTGVSGGVQPAQPPGRNV
jgi:hypothetical protein